MIMIISLMMNFLFLNFNNPLIMSLILILQTIVLNLIMGKIYFTFWFSYIMFLIFIGGLFILFIYIISLIYNNLIFMKKNKNLMIISMFIIIIFFMNMMLNNFNSFMLNYEISIINKYNLNMKENLLNMIKFFNHPNNIINLMMISYLFLLMIIVVKITNFLKGPIRSMN